jgi:hypothetical protein
VTEPFDIKDGAVVVRPATGRICARCVLPDTFPEADLDAHGVCRYCRDEPQRIERAGADVEEALDRARRAARDADYDCILLYSGGKDSSLSLIHLVEQHRLRVLALTLDNSFLSRVTAANMRSVLDAVGVEHLTVRPRRPLMHGVYRAALATPFGAETTKYSTSACGSCIGMVFAAGMRIAAAYGVPLLAGGWTPGQLTDAAHVPASFLRTVIERNTSPLLETNPALAPDLRRWTHLPGEQPLGLVNPLYAADYTEAGAIAELEQRGWTAPRDTDSCSTNCRLNGLLVLDHIRRLGYHPYAYEMAHHVRIGAMTRGEALEKLQHVDLRASAVESVAVELGVPSPLSAR